MSAYTTDFGSIEDYRKGGVMAIDDDPKNYVFSNIFEVAGDIGAIRRSERPSISAQRKAAHHVNPRPIAAASERVPSLICSPRPCV